MKACIEQIRRGHGKIHFPFGLKLGETPDVLCISNKPSRWILDLFTGYKQLGCFSIHRQHNFKEREWVNILIKDGKIIEVKKRR